jgi:hypothetical protein
VAWGESDEADARRWLAAPLAAMLPAARNQAAAVLAPAVGDDFACQLSPTLALVAPAGMSEDDQVAWLATAGQTLAGMPADLLARGCAAARRKADHPSKIVAAIFAEVGAAWDSRKGDLLNVQRLMGLASGEKPARRPWQRTDDFDPAERCSPEAAAAIRQAAGLDMDKAAAPAPTGPRRNPTSSDLAEIASTIGIPMARAPGGTAAPPITGLTVAEIFEQRDRLRDAGGGQAEAA